MMARLRTDMQVEHTAHHLLGALNDNLHLLPRGELASLHFRFCHGHLHSSGGSVPQSGVRENRGAKESLPTFIDPYGGAEANESPSRRFPRATARGPSSLTICREVLARIESTGVSGSPVPPSPARGEHCRAFRAGVTSALTVGQGRAAPLLAVVPHTDSSVPPTPVAWGRAAARLPPSG